MKIKTKNRRRAKGTATTSAWIIIAVLLFCSCNKSLNINQIYSFDLETMPVRTRIAENETVEIRCRLVKEGDYQDAGYYIRYFQPDGRGELRMDNGRSFIPNDLYPVTKEVFRLYYTSRCTEQQVIDIYIEDSWGQVVKKSFSFTNETGQKNAME